MNNKIAKAPAGNFVYLLLYFIAAVVLFLPVLTKNFVSDDYVVLKRVCLERTILVHGFFRPLSDCSIYLNYFFGGLNPLGFNLFNILIHAANSFLLFQCCLKWRWSADDLLQRRYAITASLLFLIYPFHNESVVWLLGRGSSMAVTSLLTTLLILFSGRGSKKNILWVCCCYFIGLLAYETIVILPLLVLVLLRWKQTPLKTYVVWAGALLITGVVHLLIRYKFSGALLGTYGEGVVAGQWIDYLANSFKVISRLMIPPVKNSRLFLIISVIAAFGIFVFFLVFSRQRKQVSDNHYLLKLVISTGVTLLIPVIVAVSTRTSEGDRLLYMPSLFICCLISFLICRYIQSEFTRQWAFIFLFGYNIFFLEINNYHWFKAGRATYTITHLLKADVGTGKIYIANLPGEIKGAYVFREGFRDALLINGIDTGRVMIVNRLSKESIADSDQAWTPVYDSTKIFIPPLIDLIRNGQDNYVDSVSKHIRLAPLSGSRFYFWNQHKMVLLDERNDF